jgi:phosphoribosylamine--glycine ligase
MSGAETLIIPKMLKVAILGSGAREHALAWKLQQSSRCTDLVVIPGNAGIAADHIRCAAPETPTLEATAALLKSLKIDFVVIGPDDLLAEGYTDGLIEAGFTVFGPSKKAAKLEWSKAFAKTILEKAGAPTARCRQWANLDEARTALPQAVSEYGGYPVVLKYDGLALGKGVRICTSEAEAQEFLGDVFERGRFKGTSRKVAATVLCEEYLIGHEVSVFALCDGKDFVLLDPSCDHKRLYDQNKGPNTGGMGAYSPVPWLGPEAMARIRDKVFAPVMTAMRDAKAPFQGLLYAGIMMCNDEPYVLEFNARFGDPETQALLPRLQSDLLVYLYACARGELTRALDHLPLHWSPQACVNVVAASEGYPDQPVTGRAIHGLTFPEKGQGLEPVLVFCAGVKPGDESAELVTSGGRVLGVSSLGDSVELARRGAYEKFQQITFQGCHLRRDIGSLHG